MLWFFERDDESITLETLFDNTKSEYVAIVRYPDGREQAERFADGTAFRSWLVTFEHNLEGERWAQRAGGPELLAYGWPDKKPAN